MSIRNLLILLLLALPSVALAANEGTGSTGPTKTGGNGGGGGKQQPAASRDIAGLWSLRQTCDGKLKVTAKIELDSATPNQVIGRVFDASNNVESAVHGGGLVGRDLSFELTFYILGKRNDETWTGRVAANGKSITGKIVGFWANGCDFVLSR